MMSMETREIPTINPKIKVFSSTLDSGRVVSNTRHNIHISPIENDHNHKYASDRLSTKSISNSGRKVEQYTFETNMNMHKKDKNTSDISLKRLNKKIINRHRQP